MNLHPLLLSVTVVDVLGMGALAAAMPTSARVLLGWRPGDPSESQIALERRAELASAMARLGLALHASASALLLLGISYVLPGIVPGAMCGFGAVQAMPDGRVMILLRGISMLSLLAWAEVDRADRVTPTGALAVSSARALLAAAPVAAVTVWTTVGSLAHVDVQTPVSCCAAVFDLARTTKPSGGIPYAGSMGVIGTFLMGGVVAMAALGMRRRTTLEKHAAPAAMLVIATWAWIMLAFWTLVDVAAPYIYGVVGHRCPFCLLLPSHGIAGYAAYGSLGVVLVESLRAAVARRMGLHGGADAAFALRSSRSSLARMAVAIAVFMAAGLGPALMWRIREGVWITG
jgi:hypothetical protein